jgi:hypothetical protein
MKDLTILIIHLQKWIQNQNNYEEFYSNLITVKELKQHNKDIKDALVHLQYLEEKSYESC